MGLDRQEGKVMAVAGGAGAPAGNTEGLSICGSAAERIMSVH